MLKGNDTKWATCPFCEDELPLDDGYMEAVEHIKACGQKHDQLLAHPEVGEEQLNLIEEEK